MDFITGLPRTQAGYDAIWVIMDQLMKLAYFLIVKTTYLLKKYAEAYVNEIVRLHKVLKDIVFDHDLRFTSNFWQALQRAMGTKLRFSVAYHP